MNEEAIKEFRERKKPLDKIIDDYLMGKEDSVKFWNTLENIDELAKDISRKYYLKLRWELQVMERMLNENRIE